MSYLCKDCANLLYVVLTLVYVLLKLSTGVILLKQESDHVISARNPLAASCYH